MRRVLDGEALSWEDQLIPVCQGLFWVLARNVPWSGASRAWLLSDRGVSYPDSGCP